MADALNLEGLEFLSHPDAAPRFTTKPPEWIATYLPRYCFAAADRTDSDCRGLAQLVRELHRDGFWQRLFPDWESCCQALFKRPAAWVEQVVEGVRVLHSQGHQGAIPQEQALAALKSHGGDRRSEEARRDQVAHSHLKPTSQQSSTSRGRLIPRLRRDHPEIADALDRGEFRSARAAAIEAGIIKPVPTVRLVDDAVKVAAAICRRTDQAQALAIARAIIFATGENQVSTNAQP